MFDVQQVAEAMREVVAEFGTDYVYEKASCTYADDGAPSCIVGHVIARLDPEVFRKLAEVEERAREWISLPAQMLVTSGWLPGDFWSKEAEAFCGTAQGFQDGRFTWGGALGHAERDLK